MMTFDEFLNEAILPMKKYTEDEIIAQIAKYLKKDVKELSKKSYNLYNASLYRLQKKFAGYHPDDETSEGPADEEYMKILNKVYDLSK